MLKILQIIPNLSKGGAERLCLDICNELQNQGHEVKLVTFSKKNEYKKLSENIDHVVIKEKINLRFLRGFNPKPQKLQKFIDDFQPDIIHSHLFESEIISRSCNYPKAKWFSHCHDNMWQFEPLKTQSFFSKKDLSTYYEKHYLLKRYKANGGNQFIAISKHTLTYFQKQLPEFNTTLILNAINYQNFYQANREKTGKLKLINIGSFQDKKNQKFLIEIAKKLCKNNLPFELHFLGDGKNRPLCEKLAKNYNLSEQITFHGNVDNVPEHLWKSSIYVHSAYYEPLGLVLIEAMAAGLPVITLDGGGNRDLIEEGKNGFMFFEENADAFSNKIIELWDNKNLYSEMSQYAQKYAKAYDIKPYTKKLVELYKNS